MEIDADILETTLNGNNDYKVDELDSFLQNSSFYKDFDGNQFFVGEDVLRLATSKWLAAPDDIRKKSLIPVLTHQKNDNDLHYSYRAEEINGLSEKEFDPYISRIKQTALEQVYFSREYFPSDKEFLATCEQVLSMPDDKKLIYKFLDEHSMYNLRYVPNKILLVDDCMNDLINLSYDEIEAISSNSNTNFQDILEFRDKKSDLSQINYTKSVDLMMEIIGGDKDDGNRFRKLYQLCNAVENSKFDSYSDYFYYNQNSDYYYTDDDDDDYNDDDENHEQPVFEEEQDVSELSIKEFPFNLELPDDYQTQAIYGIKDIDPENKRLLALFNQNQHEITNSAYKMCKIFGNQARNFIENYLNINDKMRTNAGTYIEYTSDYDDYIKYLQEEAIEEQLDKHLATRKKINSMKLKNISLHQTNVEVKKQNMPKEYLIRREAFIKDGQVKKDLLKLISILPDDISKEKAASFKNFMQNRFFYNLKDGTKKTRDIDEIERIASIWGQLSPQQEKLKYEDILNLAKNTNYINGRAEEFIAAAKINNLPKNMFDIAQQAYIRGIDTPRTIKGNPRIDLGDITIRFMDKQDPNIMFIGDGFSCQSITKAGVYTALSSVEDPFSRAMLIEKQGKPVGLGWVWTNEESIDNQKYTSMCIDNIELSSYAAHNIDDIMDGVKQLSKQVADENNFKRVTLGAKAMYYDPKNYFHTTDAINLPNNYKNQTKIPLLREKVNYGDSANQVLVYDNKLATTIPDDSKYPVKEVYIANRDEYTITHDERQKALSVGDAAYPWKAEFREENKNSKFMMLCDMNKNVLGYALYSDAERHIHDVAIHPEYKHYSKNLLFPLLNHMKDVGGVWKAETRESTSYALLKKMDERGSIKLHEDKKSAMGIQGERLNVIKIEFNDEKAKISQISNKKEQSR